MDHCVEEINDETDDDRQQHIQGHVPLLTGCQWSRRSRLRFGRDHALGKEYQPGKQAKEPYQEEKHEDDLKHVELFSV